MTHSQNRIQYLGLILILIAVSGCISTEEVEAPNYIYPDSSFQAVVTCIPDSGAASQYAYFGVLVPLGWDADNVVFTGPDNGSMLPHAGTEEFLENSLPGDPWDHWIGFVTDSTYDSNEGGIYEVTVTIHTDPLIGYANIAFLGMAYNYQSGYMWNGDPCSTTVEVVELNLEQLTWGSVKAQFEN